MELAEDILTGCQIQLMRAALAPGLCKSVYKWLLSSQRLLFLHLYHDPDVKSEILQLHRQPLSPGNSNHIHTVMVQTEESLPSPNPQLAISQMLRELEVQRVKKER